MKSNFHIEHEDTGRFLVFDGELLVAHLATHAEALAWITAASESDYFSSELIFPTLACDDSCVECGAQCRFILCERCYAATALQTLDLDFTPTFQRYDPPIPEVGLPVTVEGVRRFF